MQISTFALITTIWVLLIVSFLFFILWRKYSLKTKLIIGTYITIGSFASILFLVLIIESDWVILSSILIPVIYSSIGHLFLIRKGASQKTSKIITDKVSESKISFESQKPSRTSSIFICYRRSDSSHISGRIYDHLSQHFGENAIFKDVDSVPLGIDFRVFVDKVVGKCKVLLVVIGDQWLSTTNNEGERRLDDKRDFVRLEIESALKRNIPIIPLLVGRASVPTEDSLPTSMKELAFRNGTPIRPDPDFHNDMIRLIKNLEMHLK